MKFLGKVKDPKDLTTKEYVDEADNRLQESTSKALADKVNAKDISEYSATEVAQIWSNVFSKKKK